MPEQLKGLVEALDHPLIFALSLTLIVFAIANLLYWLAVQLGWTGLAAFFR